MSHSSNDDAAQQPAFRPPAAPYGASPAPVFTSPAPGHTPPPRRGNVAGVIALVVAILGAVLAAVPGAFIVGWILLPVAFVLAIVSLFLQGQRKAAGIAALIISVVGTVVGVVAFVASLATAVGSAIDEQTSAGLAEQPAASPPAAAAPGGEAAAGSGTGATGSASGGGAAAPAAEGTRANPFPLGSTVEGREWQVTVNSVDLAATDAVLAENQFNDAPAEGFEYILVNLTVTYIGNEDGIPAEVGVAYVTPDGVSIDSYTSLAVAPEKLDTITTLYTGAQLTGNVAFAVPSASASEGVLSVSPGIFTDTVFVAVQ